MQGLDWRPVVIWACPLPAEGGRPLIPGPRVAFAAHQACSQGPVSVQLGRLGLQPLPTVGCLSDSGVSVLIQRRPLPGWPDFVYPIDLGPGDRLVLLSFRCSALLLSLLLLPSFGL